MIVQNIGGASGFANPRTWLELAARAGADAEDTGFVLSVEAKIPEQIDNVFLDAEPPALLAFVDVDVAGPDTVSAVRRFVTRGGTVLLAPGPGSRPERFNEAFRSFAPVPISEPIVAAVDPQRYEQIVVEAGDEPFLRELEDPAHGHLGAPRFYRWFSVPDGDRMDEARVLLGLSDGSPLLVSRDLGRGQVLLWTAGLGGDWNSMVVHPAYPVWLYRMIQRAASRAQFPRTLQPGDPILLTTDSPRVRVLGPAGLDETVESVVVDRRRLVRFDRTGNPGRYDVRSDPDSETPGIFFDVVSSRLESDLRPVGATIVAGLEESSGGPLHANPDGLALAVRESTPDTTPMLWMGFLLILFLLAEAGLSRQLGR